MKNISKALLVLLLITGGLTPKLRSMDATTLSSLPRELKLEILKNLPSEKVAKMMRISKEWKNLGMATLKDIKLEEKLEAWKNKKIEEGDDASLIKVLNREVEDFKPN